MRSFVASASITLISATLLLTLATGCGGHDYGGSPTTAPVVGTATPTPGASPVATSAAAARLVGTGDTSKGKALTDGHGSTLYTFKPDANTPGTSSCKASCAATWPPLVSNTGALPDAPGGTAGTFSLVTRDDGSKQLAYNDRPLYRYAGDHKPGNTNGDGIGGVWFIALVSPPTTSGAAGSNGSSATAAPPQPTASSNSGGSRGY